MRRLVILSVLSSMIFAGCGEDDKLTAPTVGSCCLTTGTCSMTTQANCTGTGNWTLEGVCDPSPCPQPDGACCALVGTCTVTKPAACTGTSTWTMFGVCDPNPCPQPDGACCALDGTCTVTKPATCTTPSIWWVFSACDPNPCLEPGGACCADNGVCTVTKRIACTGTSTWTQAGVCNPDPCPKPDGSCCVANGTCTVTQQAACTPPSTWTMLGVCHPNPCPQPDGACCALVGTCTVTTRANCTGTSTWTEAGICGTNTCDPPPPVLVSNMWPHSPYGTDWWTDADPIIVVELRDPGGQVLHVNEVELLIDGTLQASWLGGDGPAEFIRGNGTAWLQYTNQDQTVLKLVYRHSTYPRDWLVHGAHTLTVRYQAQGDADAWIEMRDYPFSVDRTAPDVRADGGFVSSPNLRNVIGFIDPEHSRLVTTMYDDGAGIVFQPDQPWYYPDLNCDGLLDSDERRFDPVPEPDSTWLDPSVPEVGCWLQASPGMKYDVWLIRTPDQPPPHVPPNDTDNIEVRTLVHQGGVNDIEPWIMQNGIRITLGEYNPADTLMVPMPLMGGGAIRDNDLVEIIWYSDKAIEQNSGGPGSDCILDTVVVNGTTRLLWGPGCAYDAESQEMHIYNEGVRDWAFNSGSKYVALRFVLDMNCPVINILQPDTTTVDPAGNIQIEVLFADAGVGVDPRTASVTVLDPSGRPAQIGRANFINDRFTGVIVGPLQNGEYTIKAAAADFLGAACERIQSVRTRQ